MKNLNLIFVMACLMCTLSVFGQNVPPEFEWEGIQPQWTYLSSDPYFIKDPLDPYSSEYSHKMFVDQLIREGKLYILEATLTQSPNLGLDGYLVHKLDIGTGLPEFIECHGFFKGTEFRENYSNSYLRFQKDKNLIEITGFRASEKRSGTSLFGFDGYPIVRRINPDNGEFAEEVRISDINFNERIASSHQIIPVRQNDFITFIFRSKVERDSFMVDLKFTPMDAEGSVISEGGSIYTFNSGLRVNTTLYHIPPQFQKLNDNVLVSFTQIRDPVDPVGYRFKAEINFHTVAEDLSVNTTKILDVKPYFILPFDDYNFPLIRTMSGFVFLNNTVGITQLKNNPEKYPLWLVLFDKEGNEYADIRKLSTGNQTYFDILPIAVNDDKAYIAAIGEDQYNFRIIDIIEILPGKNKFSKIGGLKLQQEGEELVKIQKVLWDNDFLYLGLRVESKVLFSTFGTFNYHYGFDARALGLVSAVEDMPEVVHVQMYPNPVTDRLSVRLDSDVQGQTVAECTDITGHVVYRRQVDTREFQWDMSALPQGMYFVRLKQGDRMVYTGKVVKM